MKLEQALELQNGDIITNGKFKYKIKGHYDFCQYLAIVEKSSDEIQKSLEISKKYSENYDEDVCLEMIKNEERRILVSSLVNDEWSIDYSALERTESKL